MNGNTIEPTPEGAPTGTSSTNNEPVRLSLVDQKKVKWTLELHPQHLSLFSEANPQPWVFPRAIITEKMDFLPAARTMILKAPEKLTLRMSKASARTLAAWMGSVAVANLVKGVKAVTSWSGTMGILFLIGGLPRFVRTAGGGSWVGFKPVLVSAGVVLMLLWLVAKFKPHRVFMLIDAIIYLVLAGLLIMRVVQGAAWWLLIIAAFNFFIAFLAFMTYQNLAYFSPNQQASGK
jgi:hypothetical protein